MADTKLTPDSAIEMAGKHDQVAQDITGQQTKLGRDIQTLTTVNSGAMMTRLVQVHGDWDKSTKDIINQLHTMSTTLKSVAEEIRRTDEDNSNF